MAGVHVDAEKLLAELQEKEYNLVRAASYGNDLLKENEKLKKDLQVLQQELARLEEELESKQLRSLSEAKKLAEQHISELEIELETCHSHLELERAAASSAKDEFQRSQKRLAEENAELEQHLMQMKGRHAAQIQQLNEIAKLKGIISSDYNHTKRSLQQLQDENQTMEQNLSSVSKSNKRLSMELEGTKDAAGFWEDQYHSQEDLLQSQSKEMDDSRHLMKKLQLELEQKYSRGTMVSRESTSSTMSLYDELSQTDDVEQDGGPSDVAASNDNESYPYISDDEKVLTLRPKRTVCEASSCQLEKENNACQRCQELEVHGKEQEAELKTVTEQLLLAVQHKFKLQQQINSWECDMALVLGSQINHKLAEQKLLLSKQKRPGNFKGHSIPRGLTFHFIKNSWPF